MNKKISISQREIIFDDNSLSLSISSILKERFSEDLAVLTKDMKDLHDPYLLRDMDKAIVRLKQAVDNKEKVIIFWDYDVDGVTSTSLLMHLFTKLGMKVSYRLPHRVEDGYGLKTKFVDEAVELWVDLLITVDCGSRDAEIVTDAKNKGLDIIVTDHHSVPEDMPDDAIAFVNPARPDCDYPFTWLAWAGVAFKIVCALSREYMNEKDSSRYIKESIDVAAIWTVADCMQLVWENRIIVQEWLEQIKQTRSRWIRFLIEDKINEDLDGDLFGFLIGPRLNAAGRMDTPYKAVNLILNNSDTVLDTIREVEWLNELRKAKTLEYIDLALSEINTKDNILMYVSPDISHGIIGIVAGRITERFYKPSIVLIDEWEKLVASCRAPEYFSMVEILEQFKDSFITFWGHKQAAGFSILKKDFPDFQKNIIAELNKRDFSHHKRQLIVDKCIRLDQIGFKLLEEAQKFKPFGMWNPKPLFLIRDFEIEKVKFLWKWRDHLRFDSRYWFKIFAFWMWEYYEEIKNIVSCDVVCELAEDNWQWKRGIMIRVVDIIL